MEAKKMTTITTVSRLGGEDGISFKSPNRSIARVNMVKVQYACPAERL